MLLLIAKFGISDSTFHFASFVRLVSVRWPRMSNLARPSKSASLKWRGMTSISDVNPWFAQEDILLFR